MTSYTVALDSPPAGHEVPPLLRDVGAFVAQQPHGSMGYFDAMSAEAIPTAWNETHAERLCASGFAFLQLPDGSLLALLRAEEARPAAVVLLGSEGEARTIANSLEELLVRWSKGDVGIDELDDDDGAQGREALAAWVKAKKIKPPKVQADFDFPAWLEGVTTTAAPAGAMTAREETPAMRELGPKLRELAALVGQRADAPEVIAYVTKVLGKKVPQAKKGSDDYANVSAPKLGIEMVFSHDVLDDAYPPIPKGAGLFVPYVSVVWISEKFTEQVLGVPWKASEEEVVKVLGEPRLRTFGASSTTPTVPFWTRDLGGGVVLDVSFRKLLRVEISVRQASALARELDAPTGVFLGWAATRGLLNDAYFAKHAELLAAVKARAATGSELMAALPRGLWDTALVGDELRAFAYRWFYNIGDFGIRDDLGEIVDDEDTWAVVDRAAPVLQQRFAAWLG